MTQTLDTGLPPGLDLSGSYTVRFTAISPTTGLVVPGVSVSNATLTVNNRGGGDLTPPVAVGEPEWINVPQEG